MSSARPSRLTPLSYLALALVGRDGAGAHEVVQMAHQGGSVYWGGAPSGVYAELKRLAELGFLRGREAPGRTNSRTVYTLTAAGLRVLREWLAQPARFPRVKNEAHLRLLAADLLDDRTVVESFRAMLPELDRLEQLVEEMDAQAVRVPHRTRYLRLSHGYARRLVALHREWVAEVERELGGARTRGRR